VDDLILLHPLVLHVTSTNGRAHGFFSAGASIPSMWEAISGGVMKEVDEVGDVAAFRDAVQQNDVARTRELLRTSHIARRVNDPLFAFGQRAAHIAAKHPALLTVLIDAGADVTLPSEWANGPFTVLDNATEESARFLLAHGATLTPHVAARLGWLDELRALLDQEPTLVHARGGDGQQPLHQAKTAAIAELLLERGADIDARCIDHRSTPAQYALVDRPEICRSLLGRGATPDLYMAARLGDAGLAARIIDDDPRALAARINEPGYAMVPPQHIYCWTLGYGLSPHDVAMKFGHHDVHSMLMARSPDPVRFVHAVAAGDEAGAFTLAAAQPSLVVSLPDHVHAHLAFAIFFRRFAAADLMLRLGFDPSAPGMDGGSALHAACWVGHADFVDRILARGAVPVNARDSTHASTPLGWAAFGSVHRHAPGSNYLAVIDLLVKAGADVTAPGNGAGMSLIQMAEGNGEVQQALRRHGAG
jgi:ankyrin repeat protein